MIAGFCFYAQMVFYLSIRSKKVCNALSDLRNFILTYFFDLENIKHQVN